MAVKVFIVQARETESKSPEPKLMPRRSGSPEQRWHPGAR